MKTITLTNKQLSLINSIIEQQIHILSELLSKESPQDFTQATVSALRDTETQLLELREHIKHNNRPFEIKRFTSNNIQEVQTKIQEEQLEVIASFKNERYTDGSYTILYKHYPKHK